MFGSTSPFGQSSSAAFGSQSPFGQNNVTNNPFAAKPFGAPNTFASQTGSSIFGNTSTGVFGQSSSPLSTTPTFGATSSPGFGTSTAAPTFGGSSVFGQKPAFGGFGSNTQTNPFGSSPQQSQSAFGNTMFGSSSPFGTSNQPSFGSSTTPAFGSTTPGFGSNSIPVFGTTSSSTFGSTPSPAFGSTGTTFSVSSSPFGSTSTPVFGGASTFGANTAPGFGTTSTPPFGAATTSTFGTSTTTPTFGSTSAFGVGTGSSFGTSAAPSFSFASGAAFGQSSSAFGTSTTFGSTSSPFGAQTSSFGGQATTPTFGGGGFGQATLGGQRGGSRVVPYAPTTETDAAQPGKLESISAMDVYKQKSHEELRWEDYQLGDKGGPNPAGQTAGAPSFGVSAASTSPFSSTQSLFSASTSPNPFNKQGFGMPGFGTSSSPTLGSSSFGATTTPLFTSTSSPAPTSSIFATPASGFGSSPSPSPFGTSSTSGMGSTSLFGPTQPQVSAPPFGSTFNTQSSPLFQSTTPPFGQTGATFGQTGSVFGQGSGFGQSTFSTPSSTGLGSNLFPATSFSTGGQLGFGQSTPSLSTPFLSNISAQTGSAFSFTGIGQTQSASTGAIGGGSSFFGQGFALTSANQSSAIVQPVAVTNPFGTLPAMPHMSISNGGTSPSIQYGISSMPVVDKPTPVRISSLLTSRHLSQRRIKLPARKYHPKDDGSRVPFFSDDEAPSNPKADALFIPRENPRALVIRPIDQWPPKSSMKDASTAHQNGTTSREHDHQPNGSVTAEKDDSVRENGSFKEKHPSKVGQKSGGIGDNTPDNKGESYITLSGHRAGEAAIVYEHGADIEAMMPKLRHSDYYTEPRIQELAAKERAEPGFCRHVKDFVVGRRDYGSIKFLGQTDVRRLDLESLIQFNNREVIVYMDESKKPEVGQGLNKPAEVTLLNIKCYDKKTGNQIVEGPRIEKYKEMLRKKTEDQGAEFLSYDPIKGEWKFRVSHFSKYMLHDDQSDIDGDGPPC